MNKEGAISGMIVGLVFCFSYIVFFKFVAPELNGAEHWWFGISPEGIGTLGAILNFAVAFTVSRLTPEVPEHVQRLVENIRFLKALESQRTIDGLPGSSASKFEPGDRSQHLLCWPP